MNNTHQESFIHYHERLLMLIKEGEEIRLRLEAMELPRGLYEAIETILQTLKQALITMPVQVGFAGNNHTAEDLIFQEEWLIKSFLETFEALFESILNDEEENGILAC